jgi:hypothetical protein
MRKGRWQKREGRRVQGNSGERRTTICHESRAGRPRHYRKEMCHSTKRTHRFCEIFSMQVPMHRMVATENGRSFRWVRFGKRTHREACFGGVRLPRRLLRGISSDSFWKTNSPERPFRGVIKVLSTHFDLRLGTRYRAARPPAISPRGDERQRPLGELDVTTFEVQARVFYRGESPQQHVFLRNEPELPTRNCERMLQGGRRLGCANEF